MMRRLLTSILLIYTLTTLAQTKRDSIEAEWSKSLNLDEVVVTGTRTPKTLKDVPVLTRVISRMDIERTDATNIQDLLQTEMPGVEFTYAMNQTVNMNISGFAGQSVLILVDGERLAGETMDNIDFTRLSMADVERIEIVRGATSALYGSNAAGGVVNIITKNTKAPLTIHLDGRWGHHNEQRYNASVGVTKGRVANSFSFSSTSADNYEVKNRGTEPQTSTFVNVYGDNTLNFADRLRFDVSEKMHLTGRLGYFRRAMNREEDSQERYRDYQAGLKGDWQISGNDYLELSYNFDQYDKSDFLKIKRLDVRKYSNVQNSFRGLYNHTFSQTDILTLGADYMYDFLMNTNLENESRRQQSFDMFGQYDWKIDEKLELVGAVRYDYFSDASLSRVSPKLSVRWNPIKRLTLRSSYGMGFRAPTLKEKYYNFDMAGIWIVEGNPELKPETSHNFTLGAEYIKGGYSFTLTGNYNKVSNRITTGLPHQGVSGSKQWYLDYINLGDMDVYSMEAAMNARWSNGFAVKMAYMFTHEDLAESTANQYMPARKHSLTVRGEWDHQFTKTWGININLSGRALSSVKNEEYYDLGYPEKGTHEVNYPAYSLWKLQVTGRMKNWLKMTLTVDNIFNYRPEYYYYNAPLTEGTNVMFGVSIDL